MFAASAIQPRICAHIAVNSVIDECLGKKILNLSPPTLEFARCRSTRVARCRSNLSLYQNKKRYYHLLMNLRKTAILEVSKISTR
jgi:hypothetical protein